LISLSEDGSSDFWIGAPHSGQRSRLARRS
jgi:hypothetical protein